MKRHTYIEFRAKVKKALHGETNGLTWNQLREKGSIKYTRPCYNWIGKLENEIGLIRKRKGRYVYWKLKER